MKSFLWQTLAMVLFWKIITELPAVMDRSPSWESSHSLLHVFAQIREKIPNCSRRSLPTILDRCLHHFPCQFKLVVESEDVWVGMDTGAVKVQNSQALQTLSTWQSHICLSRLKHFGQWHLHTVQSHPLWKKTKLEEFKWDIMYILLVYILNCDEYTV